MSSIVFGRSERGENRGRLEQHVVARCDVRGVGDEQTSQVEAWIWEGRFDQLPTIIHVSLSTLWPPVDTPLNEPHVTSSTWVKAPV